MPEKRSTIPARSLAIHVAVAIGLCFLARAAVAAPTFDQQRKAVSVSLASQPEDAIFSLVQAGIAEDKPTQALAVTQQWLRQNVAKNPLLLYHAGRAAELSAQSRAAVALYRQYLTRADLASDTASNAVLGVYALLINTLDDPGAAYSFGRNEGHRLVSSARARQFDTWFLDMAIQRKDAQALVDRLLACIKAGVSNDLLVARYDKYFRWLLQSFENYLEQPGAPLVTPDLHAAVKALAGAITFDDELKLRLDWAVSVKHYNLAKLKGDNLDPPIAEASALLAKYPQYARRVQDGWAGGGTGRYYHGDAKKYWPHQVDAKMAPIVAALPKLSPLQRAELLQSWTTRYYDSANITDANVVRECLSANPKYVNSKSGPVVSEKHWSSLTVEEAKALAPQLAMNANPEASMIRAIAAGGKDFDKVLAALRGPEAWRLGAADLGGSNTDRLWHYTGRPGDTKKRDAEIARSKAIAKTIAAGDVKKDAPADQRIATFRKLWSDFRSAQPKIPGVRERLARVLQFTPEAVPELLRDNSPEAQILARDAIANGLEDVKGPLTRDEAVRGLSPSKYDPSILRMALRHHGMDWLKQNGNELYAPHPMEAVLRQAVADRLKRGQAEPWLIMAWINAQFPEDNAESVRLMAAMFKSAAWKALPFELRYGARAWFKDAAMTPGQYAYVTASDPELVCKDLLALPEDADVKATLAALSKAIDGASKSPVRIELVGLDQLGAVDDAVFTDPKVFAQILRATDSLRLFSGSTTFGNRLLKAVSKQRLPGVLHRISPYLWRHTELYHRSLPSMIDLARSMVDANPSAASTLALCGLETIARYSRGHRYFTPETDIPRLKAIRGKATLAMGLIDIPVRAGHPAYPIYKSQAEFAIGNEDSARELYDAHADELLAVHRNLSPAYLLWVLQRTIDQRDQERQESMVKALLAWTAESSAAFAPDQRAALEIACGDIAMQRGMLPEAHKIFAKVQHDKSYEGIEARNVAAMRRVRVERISKDFDAALQTLSEIDAQKIPRLTTAAHHARAEVYYDMQEYQDAADEIAKVLERQPAHADAIILRGRVQLQRQRLIEATEVELGAVSSQKTLVPGETLKVTLNDPTLAVSSSGSEIEVVVWATSGDKEHLLLRQFGDVRTKYRGEVKTALGKSVPDDRTLQVVGDDEIFYAYSERFRKKVTKLAENRGGPITVSSDAIMMASARKLLSESEQRIADMAAVTAVLDAKHYSSAERTDPIRLAELKALAEARSRQVLIQARVKPGNPIHVRVIDPDRSRTADIDELPISVASSSGDSVDLVVLRETGTHTGCFEGAIQTAGAQAMASASSTETGRNPNMAISPNSAYPAWRPVASKDAEHVFTVDLNDNLPLGSLEIQAKDAGFGLKSFTVQTAMNYRSWTTVARYSSKLQPGPDTPADASGRKPNLRYSVAVPQRWQPSITVTSEEGLRQERGARSVYELTDLRRHLEHGWLKNELSQAFAQNVSGPSQALPESVLTSAKWMRRNNRKQNNPAVVARFQAYFHEPVNVTRHFALTLGKHAISNKGRQKTQPEFLLAVDGRVITTEEGTLQGKVNLRPGIHRLEIWVTGWINNIGFGRTVKLRANLNDDETMVDCPDSFFDSKTFPEGILDHANPTARITANEDGATFNVNFAPNSRARLLRIAFVDQQGPVPSLNRLKLADPQGGAILPVPTDFAESHKNDSLEILTGDTITIRYVDDRHVTKGKRKHERFLNVAYSNGEIEFADIEPRYSSRHSKKEPYHEQLLRFRYDKPLSVVVYDPDMDVSGEADQVTLTIESPTGGKRQILAKETGPSTGTFKAIVTPVADATTDDTQIQVAEGGTLVAVYRDAENDKPGVPTDRHARIEHAAFKTPVIAVAHMTVTPVEEKATVIKQRLTEDFTPRYITMTTGRRVANDGLITPHFQIKQSYIDSTDAPAGIELVEGRHALIDVVAPHLALGVNSGIEVYVQTDSGRKLASKQNFNPGKPLPFDIDAPGTLRLEARMILPPRNDTPQRGGYLCTGVEGQGNAYQQIANSYKAGRFRICLPLVPGMLPEHSYSDPERVRELRLPRPYGLTVRTGERIHIGVLCEDRQGKKQWITTSAKIITHPMLDVMQEDYRDFLTEAFVGEKVRIRVVDFARDTSDDRDELPVYMGSKSGAKHYVTLRETDIHSGIFKGVYQLTYASAEPATKTADAEATKYDVTRQGFPVVYGDAVGVRYTDASGRKTPVRYFKIGKGADGTITPFCKQYDDSEMAMRTQFAMAESYLELARWHRKMGQEDQAAREFVRAKQLLANAIDQFKDSETRAHAEYLLGNLTQEDAGATSDAELSQARYQAALARFMKVTGTYPDTEYASKAQFKIAVIYERLNEPDIAAQEYVKLAYKYPDSEHLATAMARLGTHFQRKAVVYEDEAKELLAKTEDKDAQHKGTALKTLSRMEYVKAAQIFGRLRERFPDHGLAGEAGLRAGKLYIRAGDHRKAIIALQAVIDNEGYDGPNLRSPAMYWTGVCHQALNQQMLAYALYKRITYDFPESKWAAYARGQLSTEVLLMLDKKLEIQRLEEGR